MDGKQLGFSDYNLTTTKKQTKQKKFLAEMEEVLPWQSVLDLIKSRYPNTSMEVGRPTYPIDTMIRVHERNTIVALRHLLKKQENNSEPLS